MMASQNAAQATLTGELSALGPNPSEVAEAPRTNYDRYLDIVTPELSEQMDIEAGALTGWLQFKTKNYLIRDIFANAEAAIAAEAETMATDEPSEPVDPLDIFLSGDFNVNLREVRDNVVIPELMLQQKGHLESSADIVGKQIPMLRKRLTIATSDHEALAANVSMLEQQYAQFDAHPVVVRARKSAKNRLKDVHDLTKDIENHHLRAHVHDGMFAYVGRLAKSSGEDTTLEDTVDRVSRDAKLDVYREIIELLKSRLALMDEASDEFAKCERKIHALEAERDAMLAVTKTNDELEATEPQQEPLIEIHPAPEQKRALVRVMGTIGMGTGFAKKMFLR